MTVTEYSQYLIKRVKKYINDDQKEPNLSRLTFRHRDDYLDACTLLQEVYDALHNNLRCGLGTKVHLYLPRNRLLVWRSREDYAGEISRIAQDLSGIKFDLCYDDLNYIDFTLNDTAKSCTVKNRQDLTTDVFLDFAALAVENRARYEEWQQMLPDLAKAVIDRCKFCLERFPDRFLGIPDSLWVTDFNGDAMLNPEITFQFRGETIAYSQLTDNQLHELFEVVNSKLSYGKMVPTRFDYGLSVQIQQTPREGPEGKPYFHYLDFCQQYEELTPGLHNILQEIANRLTIPPTEEQILTLAPARQLIYRIDKHKYNVYSDRLTRSPYCQYLHDAISTTHPHLIFDEKPDFSHHTNSMIFNYAIPTNYTADDTLIVQQFAIENTIQDIKANYSQEIATQLAMQLLDQLDKMGIAEATNGIWDTPRSLDFFRHHIVNINYKAKSYDIDLTKVQDSEFITKIEDTVHQLTQGLFTVNINQKVYFINTSSLS